MEYLVVGQPKSGTSLLYILIKDALGDRMMCAAFEPDPAHYRDLRQQAKSTHADFLAKVVLNEGSTRGKWMPQPHELPEKTVLVLRDPRDVLVSLVLFLPRKKLFSSPRAVDRFVAALERKEADPHSVSFIDIISLLDELTGLRTRAEFITRQYYYQGFKRMHPALFLVRYEEVIRGDVASLERYLGMNLKLDIPLKQEIRFVRRSSTFGQWRHWFTEHDVHELRRELDVFVQADGYSDDWALAEHSSLKPQHGSQFVRRIVADMRARKRQPFRWPLA